MMKLKVNLRSFFDQCVLCRHQTPLPYRICKNCLNDLPWLRNHCLKCALPLQTNNAPQICAQCIQHPPSFDQVQALFSYQFPLNRLINLIKHHNKPQYLGHIAELAARHFFSPAVNCSLMPIPMHSHCQRARGFNQAELLCNELSKHTGLPIETNVLRKQKQTSTQQNLPRNQRLQNLNGSFICEPTELRNVILVDDVMTTGATIEMASRALKKQGVRNIHAWVIARTAD